MKNKQLIFAIIGIIILIVGAFIYFATKPGRSVVEEPVVSSDVPEVKVVEGVGYIKIVNGAFKPTDIKIKAGQTAFWTNEDSVAHSIISDSGTELSSSSLDKGFSYAHAFTAKGTYNYHCQQHPDMKGRIVVE
ncbi:MAG: putative plastocyanin-like protein [Parcubacteria group bacterium GW2011_GWB1_40_14]|nr:MAG: putative plastocyanin-like protein [Parcubacteria group bacterium GW2011_GWB1_40_14]